jgi:hypothetical protein
MRRGRGVKLTINKYTMKEEKCPQKCACVPHHEGMVITIKTPHGSCTVSSNSADMMLHEVLEDLVVPAIEGVGYVIKPGHIDVFYREE